MLSIKSAIAEHARKEISFRTRRGLEGLALAGKSTGGKCYGYAPGEAEKVRELFERRARGEGYGAIGAALGLARSTVRYMLANPRYAGQANWGSKVRAGGARDSRRQRRLMRPGGPLVSRHDESLRIVTQSLFSACNSGIVGSLGG
jgi:hypothetical protein